MVFNGQMFPAQLAMPILVGLIGYLANREKLTYFSIPSIAIMVSLLTLTHILTAFTILVSGSLAIVVLLALKRTKKWFFYNLWWFLGCGLGLSLAAWYWVPAIFGQNLISPE
ncbi:MAG: hypothetical protein LM514_04530, partial [Streptococcus sp.]|nr:hypothetical protein [Streptococcus sp.]